MIDPMTVDIAYTVPTPDEESTYVSDKGAANLSGFTSHPTFHRVGRYVYQVFNWLLPTLLGGWDLN